MRILVRNQGVAYAEVLRKYVAGHPEPPATWHRVPGGHQPRQVVDSGTLLPAEACEEADGFSTGQLPAVRNYYTAEGVYWPGLHRT